MTQRCRSQPEVIIKQSSLNDFVGTTGNKGKIVRMLPESKWPYEYEVEFSNGIKDLFRSEELEFI